MITREVWLKRPDGRIEVMLGEFTVIVDMAGKPVWIEGRERLGEIGRPRGGGNLSPHVQCWPMESVLKWTQVPDDVVDWKHWTYRGIERVMRRMEPTFVMGEAVFTPKIVGAKTDDGIGPFKRWMDEGFDRGWLIMHRSER
jgi:hypothetical protein